MQQSLIRLIATSLVAALSTTAFAQSTFNPTVPAAGFNIFTKSAVRFSAGDTHGPVATGGDAILAGSTIVSMNYNGYYPNGLNNTGNYGLVIGGRVWYNSGNQTQLNRGQLRLGNTTGTTVYTVNASNSQSQVQLAAGAQNSNPNIQSNSTMPLNAATTSNGLNFATAFTAFNAYSSTINNYPYTHSGSSLINFLSVPRTSGGGSETITLVNGKVNYMNLSTVQLNAMESSGITYNLSRTLDSSTVLVFNVTGTGVYNWNPAAWGAISDNSMGDGRFILYNFPELSRLNITGGRSSIGTILAPTTAVYKTGGNNAAGTIIADTFSMEYGEVHYAPFGGTLPGTSTALPIEQLTLTGTVTSGAVSLSWRNSEPAPSATLTIERSLDGASFSPREDLAYADAGVWSEPFPEGTTRVYYRLRSASPGRSNKYSAVWAASLSSAPMSIRITPNPFTERIVVTGSSRIDWQLAELNGRVLKTGSLESTGTIDGLEILPAGSYVLTTSSAGRAERQLVIKR